MNGAVADRQNLIQLKCSRISPHIRSMLLLPAKTCLRGECNGMTNKIIRFQVSIPTDEGFIGRSCSNSQCGKYFKIKADSIQDNMFCPYCGQQFSREQLLTKDQEAHLRAAAIEQTREIVFAEADKVFGNLARKMRGNKHVTFKHKPIRYRAKPVHPTYQEKPVDSEIVCTHCQFPFQVFGIFGYCPGCSSENLRIYDANLEIIKREIASSTNKQRALRHAYGDTVSTFEIVVTARAAAITQATTNFQDLYGTRRFFKKHVGKDIFDGIEIAKIRQLQRLFQKRHVYEHNNGIMGDRYVRMMPEDASLKGRAAELSVEEWELAADTLRHVLDRVVNATT